MAAKPTPQAPREALADALEGLFCDRETAGAVPCHYRGGVHVLRLRRRLGALEAAVRGYLATVTTPDGRCCGCDLGRVEACPPTCHAARMRRALAAFEEET